MLISTKGRYALRVLVDMAEHQADGYVTLKEIAERQEISEKYLESLVKPLVQEGIVTGLRGKGGGYRLASSPENVSVSQVLSIMEGTLAPVACLEAGSPPCGRVQNCRTLPVWKGLYRVIREYLSGFSIADLMGEEEGYNYVI